MVEKAEVLAIVQARGGSKGVPRKNLRLLGKHPLVAYSIVSGLAADTVTRVIVSTDDEEIAAVSRRYGAEVPFLRPAEYATDEAPDFPLFAHALQWLDRHEHYRPDVVIQLRPTSPFRPQGLIDEAVELLLGDPAADCVRGVTVPRQNPYKMWRQNEKGYLVPLLSGEFEEPYNMPRQKLPPTYWQTGHIDAIRYETVVNQRSLTGKRVLPLLIESRYCVDIDTPQDFEWANWQLQEGLVSVEMLDALGIDGRREFLPEHIGLLALDFDGVFTDNRVWVLEDGREAVACNRSDGMGLSMLRARGMEVVVLSTEKNPVVGFRCQKLNLPCYQGLEDKIATLQKIVQEKEIALENVVFVGNDVNDLACMQRVGCGVAVADAHPTVLREANLVLEQPGGYGAVRELCDLISMQDNHGRG